MNKFAIRLGYRGVTEDFPVSDFDEASVASARQEFAVKCRRIYSNDQIEANHVRVIDYLLLGSPIRPATDITVKTPTTVFAVLMRIAECLEKQNEISTGWIQELRQITQDGESLRNRTLAAQLESATAQCEYWQEQVKLLKGHV